MKQVLAIIGTTDIGTHYIAEAVRAIGFFPVFLANLKHYSGDTRSALLEVNCIELSQNTPDEIAVCLLEKYDINNIVGIISFSDLNIINSIQAAKILRVPSLHASNIALKDKFYVADVCQKYSPASLLLKKEDTLLEEKLVQFYVENGPMILKPTHGAGGEGIIKISNQDEMTEILNSDYFRTKSCNWIVQKFLKGRIFSAEGFVEEDKIEIIGFTGRRRIQGTETGASFPYTLKSGNDFVRNAITHLVNESQFRNGYFHIEFLEEENTGKLYLIDANMGRLGGGPVVDLLAFSYGVSAVDIYKHVISVSLKNCLNINVFSPFLNKLPQETMALLYGLKEGGRIDRIELPLYFLGNSAEILSETSQELSQNIRHVQLLTKNDFAKPIGTDDWAWIGIASGLKKDTQEFVDKIKIFSNGKSYSPYY